MDSEEDGNYGYDIPEADEGAGMGFRLNGSRGPSRNNHSSDDDDARINTNSSDDDDDDDANGDFAYGAYGARKSRKRERSSKRTEKERNLYGVFYDSSDDDERRRRGGGGGGGGGRGGKQSRHYDKRSNRQAGLAFVKASSSASAAAGEAEEASSEKSKKEDGGERIEDENDNAPGWLKEKKSTRVKNTSPSTLELDATTEKATQRSKERQKDDDDMEIDDSDEDDDEPEEDEEEDEEEIKALRDREEKFREWLAVAETSKNPLSEIIIKKAPKRGTRKSLLFEVGNREERQQQQRQSEAPPPASNAGENGGIGLGSRGGLGFGNNTNKLGRDEESGSAAGLGSTGLGFASSASTGLGFTPGNNSSENDAYPLEGNNNRGGLGLGTASNRGGIGRENPSAESDASAKPQHRGLGLGMGASSGIGFGSSNNGDNNHNNDFPSFSRGGGGLGLGAARNNMMGGLGLGNNGNYFPTDPQPPPKKRDPNLGKWEKHTKGIGMKLLQKMGYEGSGGLGAKRRRNAVGGSTASASADGDAKAHDNSTTNPSATAEPTRKEEEEGPIKKGISRPVEVVVRPNGLGLGFGNFKEQSQLKVNRQIEAEVRGLDLEEDNKPKEKERDILDGIDKSLLPTTDSLLAQGARSWRGGGKKGKKKKATKRKIVNYQEILDKTAEKEGGGGGGSAKKMKIIDMRSSAAASSSTAPTTATTTTAAGGEVPIGEELLHNVTLLLNTHESRLHTTSYMVKSSQQRAKNLEKDLEDMDRRKDGIEHRIAKMELALGIIEKAERLVETMEHMEKDRKTKRMDADKELLDFALDSLAGIFGTLYGNFTREERKSLKFDVTLLPSIVRPIFDRLTRTLKPLKMTDLASWMGRLAVGTSRLCDAAGSDDEAYALREIIFVENIAPWIQTSLGSSKWDVVADAETGLDIYETLLTCATASFPRAEEGENAILKECLAEEIVRNAVMPKLLRAASHWRPGLTKKNNPQQQQQPTLVDPLHRWILPWLPHLRDDASLGALLDDVRRNLKKSISFLGKSVSNDAAFVRSCVRTLSPWKRLLEESTLYELTSNAVTPRFARYLARTKVSFDTVADQDWEPLNVLFEYFEEGLMNIDDFLSLIEGEVLPAWSNALHCALIQKKYDATGIKTFYIAWKEHLFDRSTEFPNKQYNPQLSLRSDLMVCRYFYGGLKMIQAAVEAKQLLLDSLAPPHPADCNYRISLMTRSKERKKSEKHVEPNEVNGRVQRKAGIVNVKKMAMEATFQEVVEGYANQHDIAFHPKTGSNSTKDGKPVFLFGTYPVYFDKNVLFALRGSAWRPISLEHLAQAC